MSWDSIWEEVFRNQAWGKYPGEDLIRFVARNFYKADDRKKVRLLEVGCGPGANLWYMAREGFSVFGIDGSESAVDQARKRLDQECAGWYGSVVVGDIRNLPFENDYFDAVLDNEAVYANSFENSKQIYAEMARVTKSNGKLFSRTFAKGSWGDETGERVGQKAWRVSEGPLTNKGYSRFTGFEEIEQLFCGYMIKEVEMITRTMEDRKHDVKEWIIIGEKR